MTVAVVIACRNLGRTLEEAVASARAQGPALSELVVVDDASDDVFTRQALARLRAGGTQVVRTEHVGPAAARNLGVHETTAPCVTFLDADDAFAPGYLEAAVERLRLDPDLSFVSCAMQEHGGAEPPWRPSVDLVEGLVRAHVHVSTVIRRAAFDAAGGFDPRLPGLEDAALFATLAARGAKGVVLETPYLRYRARRSSRTAAALDGAAYQGSMAAILARNRDAFEPRWRELLLAAAGHIVEQRAHARALAARLAEQRGEESRLRAAIEQQRRRLDAAGRPAVLLGDLRRTTPLSDCWGLERGRPIDRVYVEAFLERHAPDIRGHVLEVKDPGYTRRYGGDRVAAVSVLDVDPANAEATIVGDLAAAATLGADRFDCVVLTQVLNVIPDPNAALANAIASLRPGGVLLCTVSALNRVSCEPGGRDGDYWRFTEAAVRHLCADLLPPEAFEVESHGNVLACTAFLYGLASREIAPADLAVNDPAFPLIVTLRAVKPAAMRAARPLRPRAGRGLVLAYHRIAAFVPDPHGLCVAPRVFDAHLRWLASRYEVLPLEELSRRALAGTLERDAVAVALDDGYTDHLDTAAPLAAGAGVPLTCFVTTAALEEDAELWWDALEYVLLDGDRPAALDVHLDGAHLHWDTSSASGRRRAHDALMRRSYTLDEPQRSRLLAALCAWAGVARPARPGRRALGRGEIAALAARPGVTVGSHTASHLDLLAVRREVVLRELLDSRLALESAIREPVRLLSFPYGNAEREIADLAAATGYAYAFTMEPRAIRPGDRPHLLPRLGAGAWSEPELERQVCAAMETAALEASR